ncbi:sterol desaturase family protein [Pedobacter cryoconitis]|uniref:sterol desaturase family protein n=1 Tax=Pedobacter cryoconitis TaxID=188932 RepID=UPI00083987BE|nr:sterol desaturase family protein [Pedobacter cryoconitis]
MKLPLNYLAFIIPVFFIFLLLEYKMAKRKKKEHYFKHESSVANVSIGIAERLINLFVTAGFYQVFDWIYTNYAIVHIPGSWWVWIILMLATDFLWYWYHRLGHEINFLWAAHIVHHQSEEFSAGT